MFRTPCHECTAHVAAQLEKDPLASTEGGVALHYCPHEQLGIFLLVRHGFVADWSLWPSSGPEEMKRRMDRATHDTLAGVLADQAASPTSNPAH